MSDFISRMQKELDELNDKIQKLSAFLYTPVFNGLSAYEQLLLKEQRRAMLAYSELLMLRLEMPRTS